ncbi:hypothetical protein [Actinomadura parmotrematis]|uniref:DUF3068 domain-containing protein n=1 Tax=Actinomadura parmotrematis TaxID=2864039 RepID=A0ABS7FVT2_9ACTN|nr:hypothetical protein [Actinomadura parmotrematis]MBW8483789.1 hypothetical protein [Actinomadura parmotrematis]
MRRLLILISGLALLAGLARALRRTPDAPPQADADRPPPPRYRLVQAAPQRAPAPPAPPRRAGGTVPRILVGLVLAALGTSCALIAHQRYEDAAPPMPNPGAGGRLGVVAPDLPLDVRLTVSPFSPAPDAFPGEADFPERASDVLTRMDVTLTVTRKRAVKSCETLFLGFDDVTAPEHHGVRAVTAATSRTVEPRRGLTPVRACPAGGTGTRANVALSWIARRSSANVSGFRAAVATPAIGVSTAADWRAFTRLARRDAPLDLVRAGGGIDLLDASVTIGVAPLPLGTRVESAGWTPAAPSTVSATGIAWRSKAMGSALEQRVAVVRLQGEEDARRALLLAGILGGLAAGLLPWAGFLLLDAALSRRRAG